jgi:tripartite-type tricarboxylate transporter receptor subunit TctC
MGQRRILFSLLCLMGMSIASRAAENYIQARTRIIASGLKPAPIPRGGKFDQCGDAGEQALCKRFPELINCVGMGSASGTCRMVFVAPDGSFTVASAYGWERPSTMVLTGIGPANAEDTKHIKNILAGKPELAD